MALCTTCPDCMDDNNFCKLHQAHEKEVYESTIFEGKHDTLEFRCVLYDARNKDLEGD